MNLPDEPNEALIEFEATPQSVENEDESAQSMTAELAPQTLALTKQSAVIEMQPPNHAAAVSESDISLVTPLAPSRRAPRSEVMVEPAEVPSRPRRVVDVPAPQLANVVEQVAGVDDRTPPDFSANRPPAYPAEAIRRRLEGTVLLQLHIDISGRVERVDVVETSGHVILDRASVQAIETWRGVPAYRAGQPVASVELLPVRFKLGD